MHLVLIRTIVVSLYVLGHVDACQYLAAHSIICSKHDCQASVGSSEVILRRLRSNGDGNFSSVMQICIQLMHPHTSKTHDHWRSARSSHYNG